MPNFSPNSTIYIGRVPFDNSYRHTMTFASATAQYNYFYSVCTRTLDKANYTYVRMNNAIRVPFNAESLYTYNYVMYKNANYGNKWFYAFIVAINYVNENMTELVLELDVMQTWYFDYTLKQCFVEREHVNSDTIGEHLNPEPSLDLQYVSSQFSQHSFSAYYIVLLVNQIPHYRVDPLSVSNVPCGSDPASGGKYQNFFSGCKAIVFYNTPAGVTAFKKFLDDLNKAGAADTIADAFTIPSASLDANDIQQLVVPLDSDDPLVVDWNLPDTYFVKDGAAVKWTPYTLARPAALDGYTPHNKKLLTYPYTFLEVGDFSGRVQDYRWEYFGTPAAPVLIDKISGISDGIGYVTPLNYNGITENNVQNQDMHSTEPFTYNFGNKISWTYSAYQNWMAQNAVGNQLAVLGGTIAMVTGVVSGINAYNASQQPITSPTRTIHSMRNGKMSHSTSYSVTDAQPADYSGALKQVAGGAGVIAGVAANIARMRRVPNTAKGNTEGNSKFQNGYAGWYYCTKCIRNEFAKIVDAFFDMYGYQVDIVKVPNREGRPSWNYVKTANACHYGNVPADDMARINAIYDAGITFWHTSDVGNYSLSNAIVVTP